jgi:hypothetical protein
VNTKHSRILKTTGTSLSPTELTKNTSEINHAKMTSNVKTKTKPKWREMSNIEIVPKIVINMLPNNLREDVDTGALQFQLQVFKKGNTNDKFVKFITEGWGSEIINFGGFGDIKGVTEIIDKKRYTRIGKTLLAYTSDNERVLVTLFLPFYNKEFKKFTDTFVEHNFASLANLTFGEDHDKIPIPQYIHYKDFSGETANDLVIERLKADFGDDCESEKFVICIYKLPGTPRVTNLTARAPRVQKVETSANIGVKTPTAAKPPVERIAAVVKFELAEAKVKKTGEFGLARQIAEELPKKHALRKAVMNLDKSSTKREIKNALMIFDSTDPEKVYKELKFANDLKPKYNAEVVKQYPDKVMKQLDKMANEKHNSRAYNVH